MKLLTKNIEKELIKNHDIMAKIESADINLKTYNYLMDNLKVPLKIFGGGAADWQILYGEKQGNDWLFFAVCDLGIPDQKAEIGSVLLSQLEKQKFPPLGLGVERDMYYKSTWGEAKKIKGINY